MILSLSVYNTLKRPQAQICGKSYPEFPHSPLLFQVTTYVPALPMSKAHYH